MPRREARAGEGPRLAFSPPMRPGYKVLTVVLIGVCKNGSTQISECVVNGNDAMAAL